MQRKQVRAAKQTNSRWISESENLEVRRWEHFAVVSLLCEILFIRWLCQVQTNGDWRLDQWLNADKLPFRDSQIAPMAKERFKQFFYSCQSSKTMLAPLLTSKTNDVGHSFFFPLWVKLSYLAAYITKFIRRLTNPQLIVSYGNTTVITIEEQMSPYSSQEFVIWRSFI